MWLIHVCQSGTVYYLAKKVDDNINAKGIYKSLINFIPTKTDSYKPNRASKYKLVIFQRLNCSKRWGLKVPIWTRLNSSDFNIDLSTLMKKDWSFHRAKWMQTSQISVTQPKTSKSFWYLDNSAHSIKANCFLIHWHAENLHSEHSHNNIKDDSYSSKFMTFFWVVTSFPSNSFANPHNWWFYLAQGSATMINEFTCLST